MVICGLVLIRFRLRKVRKVRFFAFGKSTSQRMGRNKTAKRRPIV